MAELVESTALHDALLDQELGYPRTDGTIEPRQTIAGVYPGATLDNVQVTNGGSEANFILLMHLVEPGYFRVGLGSDPKYLESALSLIGEFLSSVGAHAR